MTTRNIVLDRGFYTTCTISPHGATIISWRIRNIEHLFVSRKAVFNDKHPIRGGISFIFPQFGQWIFGPHHGFAKIIQWKLESPPKRLTDGNFEVVFSLTDDDFTRSMWNYPFKLTYRVTLYERELHLHVTFQNTSQSLPLAANLLLHTYMKVPDVTQAHVVGLQGSTFVDDDGDLQEDVHDDLNISESIDRVYHGTPQDLTIQNVMDNKDIKIIKKNFPDTVVWNPWIKQAKEMADFGVDECYKMVCIETGFVKRMAKLQPGQSIEAEQIFVIEPRL